MARVAQKIAQNLNEFVSIECYRRHRIVSASDLDARGGAGAEVQRDGVVQQFREIDRFTDATAPCVSLLRGYDLADVLDVHDNGTRFRPQLDILSDQLFTQLCEVARDLPATLVAVDEFPDLIPL